MEGKELEEALKQDQAQKEAQKDAQASSPVGQDTMPVPVDFVVRQLEQKEALLAKTVVLGLLDVARTFVSRAMGDSKTKMVDGNPVVEIVPADPTKAMKLLEVAMQAAEIARQVDILGDKAVVRGAPTKSV